MTGMDNRRFTLLDAMVLVMAAGVGLALAQHLRSHDRPSPAPVAVIKSVPGPRAFSYPRLRGAISSAVTGSALVFPSVLTFTFATLALRFRHPRPCLARIFRQPGAVGCSAAILSFLLALLTLAPSTLHSLGSPIYGAWMVNAWLHTSRMTGVAVASAWLALALSGRWRSERTWVDRLGQAVSASWIAAIALEAIAVWT